MKLFIKHICFSLLLLIFAVDISAQIFQKNRKSTKEDLFQVDHALFRSEISNSYRLEVYYQIYNGALHFIEEPNGFKAEYDVQIRVLGKKDRIVDSITVSKTVFQKSESKIHSSYDYRTNQHSFILPPEKYKVRIKLIDPLTGEDIEKKFDVKAKKLNYKKPRLSDVELVQGVMPRKEEPSPFDKGDYALIPSVTHRYGAQADTKLRFYLEVYQGREWEDSVRIETSLRHFSKGLLYRDSMTTYLHDTINRQYREINMEELRPGEYELKVGLFGKRKKKYDVKYRDFRLIWTSKGMIQHDFKTIIKQIEIIADKQEVQGLKEAKTYDEKIEAFNAFWLTRDPTKGTVDNEFKTEFYRRVGIANENFSYFNDNGWKTDRGRVYIMFGEPDQIDDYPIVPNQRPYQEWFYYRGNKYRRFVFVDVNEDGDYKLTYPYDGLYLRPEDI